MIVIDDDQTTLHVTRGNATSQNVNVIALQYPIWNFDTEEEELYEFQAGDKLMFTVYNQKGFTKTPILQKETLISAATTTPVIDLSEYDTLLFEPINKKKTYWYDITLNGDNTIIGMDDDGAKKMIVYPSYKYPASYYDGGEEE